MADQKATLKTNRGDIVINLFPNHAPETVDNFVGLAEGTKDYRDDAGRTGEKYYDGLGFHRVIDGFMIQGGGMAPGMKEKKMRAPVAVHHERCDDMSSGGHRSPVSATWSCAVDPASGVINSCHMHLE